MLAKAGAAYNNSDNSKQMGLDRCFMDRHSARVEQNASTTADLDDAQILLAEDDSASGRFLSTSFEALGCRVIWHADGQTALNAAITTSFDLLVIDLNLPQLDGASLLRQLRTHINAASRATVAVATSAEWNIEKRQIAHAAGFTGVIGKPCTTSELRHMLETHIDFHKLPVCHDGAALHAAGSMANLTALRRLFVQELTTLSQDLPALYRDRPRLLDRLHRLCASAGFCGAPALASACQHWLALLRTDPDCDEGRTQFEQALHAARSAFS